MIFYLQNWGFVSRYFFILSFETDSGEGVTSYVSLKVFDVLGKEVVTLVNQIQNAGSYEVVFDGSDLSSGVYFYKLETTEFNEVKRMVLVK